MKQNLFSQKYRPKSLDDIIILPRIRKIFENGLDDNVILYGHFGTGKTSLARILIGKYAKTSPMIELNSSYYTSIDVLRSKVDDFCTKVYMGLDMNVDIKNDTIKYVFLDEFERTSAQYQDALKAYIEDFSQKNVRFILVTNHINKVTKGILSRLTKINFDCQDINEEKFLKNSMYKKIMEEISIKEGFTISKENLVNIINKNFPDFRQTLIALQHFIKNGDITSASNIDIKKRNTLYDFILKDKVSSFEEIYNYIFSNFGAEKIDEMIYLLGTPFVQYVIANEKSHIEKLFSVAKIITEHTHLLETNTDPLILGITVVIKIKEIFHI